MIPGIIVVAAVFCVSVVGSDLAVIHERSVASASARFEIVQSTLAAKWTFKLDRVTGRVWQMVKTSKGQIVWEEMPVESRPRVPPAAAAVRFQLFASGLAARHTFLLDTQSGQTWQLVSNKDESGDDNESSWELMGTEK